MQLRKIMKSNIDPNILGYDQRRMTKSVILKL